MPGPADAPDARMSPHPPRRIVLSGAVNFRDLGGYATADGRRVCRARVFRADQLADLSDEDLRVVRALGLRHICDLRADVERAQRPNRVVPGVRVHAIGFMPKGGAELMAQAGSLTVEQVEQQVGEIYRDFICERRAAFAQLFALMLEADALPLLFHCTSGRDRTGTAAALLLSALGVPRGTILADYELSNAYRRDLRFQLGEHVDPVVMAAITRAHPAYLHTAFEAMQDGWGSTENYLRQALGLSDAARTRLQALLLETPTSEHSRMRDT